VTWAPASNFAGPLAGQPTCVVVLADPVAPELASYDAQYESTYRACGYGVTLGS
jgi:hypothetical protein